MSDAPWVVMVLLARRELGASHLDLDREQESIDCVEPEQVPEQLTVRLVRKCVDRPAGLARAHS